MRRRRLGIAVGSDHVDAVLIVGATVRWRATARVGSADTIDVVVSRLLEDLPPARFSRTYAYVALGPRLAQVKRLEGLPPLRNRRLVTQLVRENASAFFLQRSPRLLVPPVSSGRDEAIWGAAFDADAVNAIVGAVRARGRLVAIVPVPRAARPGDLPAALAKLGPDGVAYLDSYNATRSSRHTPFAWRPEPTRTAMVHRVRVTAAALLVATSVLVAILSPALRDALYIRQSAPETLQGEMTRLKIDQTTNELARVTRLVNRIESFRTERGRVTRLLGALAKAIPESTAIVTLRVDSMEGNFVAIAPRVTDVLPSISSVEGIAAPRIVGSVTLEALSGIRVERGAFRFRRPRRAGLP